MPARTVVSKGCVIALVVGQAASIGLAQPVTFTEETFASGLFTERRGTNGAYEWMMGGGCIGDFNDDGFQDVFVLGGNEPDKLFINNGNGTFTNQAAAWGVAVTHIGSGAIAVDYNKDGWEDIYVTSWGARSSAPSGTPSQHKLYRNNGNGTFTNVAVAAGVHRTSASAADGFGASFGDYDLDGHLDLAVAGWRTGTGNKIFHSNGNGTFTDVTSSILGGFSFSTVPSVRGFSPWFIDTNGDRYPDLLWTADGMTSKYFRNNANGTFTEITGASGTGLDGNGMGAYVADLDRDGKPDWYVTSITTTNVVPSVPGTGNMLYRNLGNHTFAEVSNPAGVKQTGWGWGTAAVDFDHDGNLDLIATNGTDQGTYMGEFLTDPTCLFMNNANGTFTSLAGVCGIAHTGQGRGLVTFDADNDGDQDIIIFSNPGAITFYRNELDPGTHSYLRVFLNSRATPGLAPEGIGARVVLNAAASPQYRWITANPNYLGNSERSAHFGLAGSLAPVTLRVEWADGRVSEYASVAPNQTITVLSCAADFDRNGQWGVGDLFAYLDAWFAGGASADVNFDKAVGVSDLFDFLDAWFVGCN